MHDSMSPPWCGPNARIPAATQSFSGAPVVATLRAASVDGGVTPWSTDDTSTAFSIRPIAGVGSSPISRR